MTTRYDSGTFEDTPQFIWLYEHCWDFGFILRYPKGKEDITGIIIYSYNVNYIVPRSRIDMKESVGIEEVDSEELSIYPNPVRDILNINAEVSKVEIFAVNGQQLLTSQSNSINISNLPAGMYFVRAQLLNGKVAISKFVKR